MRYVTVSLLCALKFNTTHSALYDYYVSIELIYHTRSTITFQDKLLCFKYMRNAVGS